MKRVQEQIHFQGHLVYNRAKPCNPREHKNDWLPFGLHAGKNGGK
jgi:hypothetical protein